LFRSEFQYLLQRKFVNCLFTGRVSGNSVPRSWAHAHGRSAARLLAKQPEKMGKSMKKVLIAGALSTAMMSSAAFAQSNTDSADLGVTATVNQECSIEDPTPVVFAEVNINEGAGPNALLLKNGSQSDTQSIYVSCNYAAKLSATSTNGGLLNAAGAALAANDPADFTNLIEYR